MKIGHAFTSFVNDCSFKNYGLCICRKDPSAFACSIQHLDETGVFEYKGGVIFDMGNLKTPRLNNPFSKILGGLYKVSKLYKSIGPEELASEKISQLTLVNAHGR